MITHLLDTNVCVDWLRGRNQSLLLRIRSHSLKSLATCSIVLGELYYGAAHSADPAANILLIRNWLNGLTSVPFEDADADVYGAIRQSLTSRGQVIGANDMLIAAIAVRRQWILVTRNVSEFARVPGLTIENWHV